MSARRTLGAALVALALVAAGCGSSSDDNSGGTDAATRVFKADNGDVTIPAAPKRIVATGYAVPVLIEAGAALVGISTWKRGTALMSEADLATYNKLTKVAGETAAETNYEAVAAAKPDLIVIGVPLAVLGDLDMDRLKSVAPVVVIGPTKPSDWRTLSERQSDAAARLDRFSEIKAAYDRKASELKAKYASALSGVKFGHVGAYGDAAKGTFMREFAGAWGTNIAGDIGVEYYGEVRKKGGGGLDVSEYPSVEEVPASLGQAQAVTYSVGPDGTPVESVKRVLDSDLWKNLPAVKAGKVFPIRYTEAATYPSAMKTLDAIDQALAPLLAK